MKYLVGMYLCLSLFFFLEGTNWFLTAVHWQDDWYSELSICDFVRASGFFAIAFAVYCIPKKFSTSYYQLFYRKFAYIPKVMLGVLILMNFALTLTLCKAFPESRISCLRIGFFVAGTMGNFDLAERIYKICCPHSNMSYITISRHSERDINGVKADDPKIDAHIVNWYGPHSRQMADRKLSLAKYYAVEKKNHHRAIEILNESLGIYKNYSEPLSTLKVLKRLAISHAKVGNKESSRKALQAAEQLISLKPSASAWSFGYELGEIGREVEIDKLYLQKFRDFESKFDVATANDLPERSFLQRLACSILPPALVIGDLYLMMWGMQHILYKESRKWKTQLSKTENVSEALLLINDLIVVESARKTWDAMHLYTEMSSRLNSKLP